MWIRCIFYGPSLPFLPLERRDFLCFTLSNVTVTSAPSSAPGVDQDTINPCFMSENRAWTGLPRTSQLGGGRAGIGLQSAWPQGTQLAAEGFPAHGRPPPHPTQGCNHPAQPCRGVGSSREPIPCFGQKLTFPNHSPGHITSYLESW